MPTDEPTHILNRERLAMSAGGDSELMEELAALYIRDTDAKLQGLGGSVAAGEAERSGDVAHGIKGASAAVGAEEAVLAFRALEELGRAGDMEGLVEALREARDAYMRVRAELRDLAA